MNFRSIIEFYSRGRFSLNPRTNGLSNHSSKSTVSLLTGRYPNPALSTPIEIDLFSLRMQLDRRINLGLASYACVAHACMHACVYAHARTLVQPECLQNTWIRYHRRVTHACTRTRVHQSSFTPICLRSPETIQTRVLPSTRYIVLNTHLCACVSVVAKLPNS